MLAQLTTFFRPARERQEAYLLYSRLVQQARQEVFFSGLGVPDTLDGRFELIVLHLFLVTERLKSEPQRQKSVQFLTEAFFDDMDRTLRELGVGDTGVGRRVQKMASAFYGRLKHYGEALGDNAELKAALARNLYGTVETPPDAVLTQIAHYLTQSNNALKNKDIVNSPIVFPPLPSRERQ